MAQATAAAPAQVGSAQSDQEMMQLVAQGAQDVGKQLGLSPQDALDVVQRVLHRSSSSQIDSMQNGRGFRKLGVGAHLVEARGSPRSTLQRKFAAFRGAIDSTPPWNSVQGQDLLSKIALEVTEFITTAMEGGRVQDFKVFFEHVNGGKVLAILIEAVPWRPETPAAEQAMANGDPLLTVRMVSMCGEFSLMPDLVFTSHTKKSFLSSKSWVEISERPRGVTRDDIVEVLRLVVQPMVMMQDGQRALMPA